jgi:peptide deformylase
MLDIIKEPNPLLSKVSQEVSEQELDSFVQHFMNDMLKAMYASSGVGLAAPQVGTLKRIIVADIGYVTSTKREDYMKESIKMINPKIISSVDTFEAEEGCLSVPDFSLNVERPRVITVSYIDENFVRAERTFENFASTVICHEIDHLNGITLLKKASRLKRYMYLKHKNK